MTESSRIQVEAIQDMTYLLNTVSTFLTQNYPGQESLIEEIMNEMLPKLGPNIEVSGMPYDLLLEGQYRTVAEGQELETLYEPLDEKAAEKLSHYVMNFEEDLKSYLSLQKEMPLKVQEAFSRKLQRTAQNEQSIEGGCADVEEALLEKLVEFETLFGASIGNVVQKESIEVAIQQLAAELPQYSYLEKELPALNAKYARAKVILQEEIEEAQRKLDARKKLNPQTGLHGEQQQDIILKGIQAAQQRLKELKAFDPSLEEDAEEQGEEDPENNNVQLSVNSKRKKRRKSLIERQVEMKEQLHTVTSFLHTLQNL